MQEKSVRDEWSALIAAMRGAMDRQLSPREPEVQALARQWMDLLRRTVSEDPDVLHDVDGTQPLEPGSPLQTGVDVTMLDYLSAALWAKYLTLDESKRLCLDGPKRNERARLLSALREEMDRGASVASPAVQQLFRQWERAVDELTAGDAELRRKWTTAARSDPDLLAGSGVDTRLQNYLRRAQLVREVAATSSVDGAARAR
ncbi:MAG: TipAS antibiotic-recognition domain-containing protein [Sulfurifustis sp.]